jgi:hypothetical protein
MRIAAQKFQMFAIVESSLASLRRDDRIPWAKVKTHHVGARNWVGETKLGNAGLIRDQRYRTDPDAGMPMPD